MNERPHPQPVTARPESGFSTIEVLVYFVLALVVVTSVYKMLIGQNRLYLKQTELQDVRTSLRTAGNYLAFELRQVSAAGGDIYSMSTNGVTVRSVQGVGIVCGIDSSTARLGLYATRGEFNDTANDSVMVYAAGDDGTDDDQWLISDIEDTMTTGGVDTCAWPGSVASDITIEVDSAATVGVYVGAPLRSFHRVQYGEFYDEGRWWLGRKVGAAASYDKLTGPLRSPTDSGLVLVYYDQTGNITADSSQVSYVDIVLRGESHRPVPGAGGPEYQADTLTFRVTLRG